MVGSITVLHSYLSHYKYSLSNYDSLLGVNPAKRGEAYPKMEWPLFPHTNIARFGMQVTGADDLGPEPGP